MIRHGHQTTQAVNLGFEAKLFISIDRLFNYMGANENKHVVLGMVFLKYFSDTFIAVYDQLKADEYAEEDDPDEYLAKRVYWVPEEARWDYLQANANATNIGSLIERAMQAVENSNQSLKGVLPTEDVSEVFDEQKFEELIGLISTIDMYEKNNESKDIIGRVFEYFLNDFARADGKKGGDFYTSLSVVRVLTEMLQPYKGRVYDPCCGSGSMFVQSEKFVTEHGGQIDDIRFYGQELNKATWRVAKMNMALRGIDADIKWNDEGSFQNDALAELKADFILANPAFNNTYWGAHKLHADVRWKYGIPPINNADFAWLQHIIHHLEPNGMAGVVMSNETMWSNFSGVRDIRRRLIEDDVIDCMVSLPGQLFYSTQLPACLWILTKNKNTEKFRSRNGEVLFINAPNLGFLDDHTRRVFRDKEIAHIAETYNAWRGESKAVEANGPYENIAGFCFSASLEDIKTRRYELMPSRFVGVEGEEDDDVPFEEKFKALKQKLESQLEERKKNDDLILFSLNGVVAK